LGKIKEKLRKNYQDFLKTVSLKSDPQKIYQIGDQFWRISEEFLVKFPGNSPKLVTKAGDFQEIPHFCYLGSSTFL